MRVTEIISESIRDQKFDEMIKTKMFEVRKDHLETIFAGIEAINGVSEVEYKANTQADIDRGTEGRLTDDFQGCHISFKYHDFDAVANLSISGYSITVSLTDPVSKKRDSTSQSQSFKLMINKMEKLYKQMKK